MSDLRTAVSKLASEQPDLRKHLVPLLRKEALEDRVVQLPKEMGSLLNGIGMTGGALTMAVRVLGDYLERDEDPTRKRVEWALKDLDAFLKAHDIQHNPKTERDISKLRDVQTILEKLV